MPFKAANPLGSIPDPGETFKNPQQAGFMRRFQDVVASALIDRPGRNTATDSVMLQSPNGSMYRIVVDDTGVISATIVGK